MLAYLRNFFSCFNKICCLLILIPLCSAAQQTDSIKTRKDSLTSNKDTVGAKEPVTQVTGQVTDAVSGKPIPFASISIGGSTGGASSDKQGRFTLSLPAGFTSVTFSSVGYQSVTKTIKAGQVNALQVRLSGGRTLLKEVSVTAKKRKRYRNKGNPAVELIQEVINHKEQNRMGSSDYLQYNQYERIGLSFFNLSPKLTNGRILSKYKFMLDTTAKIDGKTQTMLPFFFSEKAFQKYYRKSPPKSITVLKAQKEINIVKFIDTAGASIYLNKLYGENIDIYSNNILILTDQFLSPIADHAPDFYKFFIVDTIQSGNKKIVEISFTPRTKGDLLFEGKLQVTLDGHYAVASCQMNINKHININFLRSLEVALDFQPYEGGRYYLAKSTVKADFGILRNRGAGVFGERTVFYSNYKLNAPLPDAFYQGKSLQAMPDANQADTAYWARQRPDTLSPQRAAVYAHVNQLQSMRSFKRASWIASAFANDYLEAGPVQVGPMDGTYSFNTLEGSRFQVGGRTTPQLNKNVYLEGYAAYGTTDAKLKYQLSTYFSLNQKPYYQFPNNYFKVSYLFDVNVPGQGFGSTSSALASFHSGTTTYFLYNKIFAVSYAKDLESHFSYNITLRNWDQQAAGSLVYQLNDADNSLIKSLNTREASLGLRYAPHEQILQGSESRTTIVSKNPIFNLTVKYGSTKIFNQTYSYTNIAASIRKRLYMSQLGYSDVTLLGGIVAGKVPFPLLNISPANQSIALAYNSYNAMDYLEFVSDHYAGINFNHSFNGFFLNKIPLIDRLKWREYFSFKILYGGLRNENNPLYSNNLFKFPVTSNGTYALGNTPYTEAGVGIGNIFKVFRIDAIRRFNYLDHPGISRYVIKFTFDPNF